MKIIAITSPEIVAEDSYIIGQLVDKGVDVIHLRKPDADIVFWTYNWGRQPEKERVRLIENLPTDITLLAATIDKCEKVYFEDDMKYFWGNFR